MKKNILLGLTIFFCLFISIPAQASPTVILDGKQLAFDVSPVIENGRVLVHMPAIFEAMGATVSWDQNTQKVIAVKNNTSIVLFIGSLEPTINGQINRLDVAAKIINNQTLVPLRFIGEAFGGTVNWDSTTETVIINKSSYGKLTFPNGTYEGEINDGLCNGQGIFIWVNGTKYEGAFVDGIISGQGTCTWSNGDKYVGEWLNNKRHGSGTLYKSNGLSYNQNYNNDELVVMPTSLLTFTPTYPDWNPTPIPPEILTPIVIYPCPTPCPF